MFENNIELQKTINEWLTTKNRKLVKKLVKLSSPKYVYTLCKDNYRNSQDYFFIRSIRNINLFYKIKAKTFLNAEKRRLLQLEYQRKGKIEEINGIISKLVDDDKFVYIMQYSFFDKKGENYFSGGGERYACDLSALIQKMGYKVILLQAADVKLQAPWCKNFNNIHVIGINAEDKEYFKIINSLVSPKLAIYSGAIPWEKSCYPSSILISHGITWDHPCSDANISWLKNILNVANTLVSVDTNTISWFRSTYARTIADNNIKMSYVPNYVNLDKYYPKHNKNDSQRLKIVYPRRCSAERGFWLIANIIPQLMNEFDNIEFELVGYAHTPEIEEKIAQLKKMFPERFHHYVSSPDDMANVYQNADISVIPTEYSEGTSLSCIEAMACGNAVVSTNIGGLPNLIINNYNGILTEPYQEDIYMAIKTLILNVELREKLQKNAVDIAKVFSKKTWEDSWNNILKISLKTFGCNFDNKNNSASGKFKVLYLDKFFENTDVKTNKRLFITTGFISLINAMSVIDMLNDKSFDNYLIIYSGNTSNSFKQYNLNLILDGYFKQAYFANNLSCDENIKYIEDKDFLNQFNEIYTTAQPIFNIWNMHKNINLIEEGISSYFSFDVINYNNIKKIYLSDYFGKIHYKDASQNDKICTLNKQLIKNIIEKIKAKNNLNFENLRQDNQILLLAQYIYQDVLVDDEVVNFYKHHIDNLIKRNYSVLFKSHPRVNDAITGKLAHIYKDNPKFNFVSVGIKYPVELMINDLNLKAIVTSMSGGAINCAHLFGIPCYGFGAQLIKEKHPLDSIKEYAGVFLDNIPHIDCFYK